MSQIIEAVLSVLCWALVALAVLALPLLLGWTAARCFPKRRVAVSRAVFAGALLLVLAVGARLWQRPLWSCPEKWRDAVTEGEKAEVLQLNRGFYSVQLPLLAVNVRVEGVCGEEILVQTQYFPLGRTQMSVGADGPGLLARVSDPDAIAARIQELEESRLEDRSEPGCHDGQAEDVLE